MPERRPNKREIPEWAQKERQGDLGWIRENLHVFWPVATLAFDEVGRGVIVVDTTQQPIPGDGNPFAYLSQEQIEEHDDEDTKRLVREYNPKKEFVILLLKAENRNSTYRVQTRQKLK